MEYKQLPFLSAVSAERETFAISVSALQDFAESWYLDCSVREHSTRTLTKRRLLLGKFFWYLQREQIATVTVTAIRRFLHYVRTGHEDPNGRWGNPRWKRPVKPGTVASFHSTLRTFFNWVARETDVDITPMKKIAPPVDRPDQIQPFTYEEIVGLLIAARQSRHPDRDVAILLFLLDTGVRVSELCDLTVRDVNLPSRSARVQGKGGKDRTVYFGRRTAQALWKYLRTHNLTERTPEHPFWVSLGGKNPGDGLTRNGVLQMVRRLGQQAHITHRKVSVHTFRHTFAVQYLRNGGNQFTLMELLGHTDLKMTRRYVLFAEADVETQYRRYSPVDHWVDPRAK